MCEKHCCCWVLCSIISVANLHHRTSRDHNTWHFFILFYFIYFYFIFLQQVERARFDWWVWVGSARSTVAINLYCARIARLKTLWKYRTHRICEQWQILCLYKSARELYCAAHRRQLLLQHNRRHNMPAFTWATPVMNVLHYLRKCISLYSAFGDTSPTLRQ
jgi:hypothetical protein